MSSTLLKQKAICNKHKVKPRMHLNITLCTLIGVN